MTAPDKVRCPGCRGSGRLRALLDFADRSKSGPAEIDCNRCGGTGAIDLQEEEWMRAGGTHRTWRVCQHESQRDCAARLGIGVADLIAMESGKLDPARVIQDTPEILRNGYRGASP